MKVTLSVIKADIGSIGGHIAPSRRLFETVRDHVRRHGEGLLIDSYISHTGDDIAILMTHTQGVGRARSSTSWPGTPFRQERKPPGGRGTGMSGIWWEPRMQPATKCPKCF